MNSKKLVAATFTPLTEEGEINLSVIGPYVDYLTEKQGVKRIFVNGTTGEGMSLSVNERKLLAREWVEKARGKMDEVIVHIGCTSLKESQELARHAAEIGADSIALITPSFYKPASADVLRKILLQVASVVPAMPIYYYHLPQVTGVNLSVADMVEGIEELLPSFSGVKFSGVDLMDFGRCVHHSKCTWSLLYGVDEQLLAALALGADGGVGSTYNYIGSHFNQLISAFNEGNLTQARRIQFKLQDLLSHANKLGFNLGVNKQLMTDVSGLHLGPPRLPVTPCPQSVAQSVLQKYKCVFSEC